MRNKLTSVVPFWVVSALMVLVLAAGCSSNAADEAAEAESTESGASSDDSGDSSGAESDGDSEDAETDSEESAEVAAPEISEPPAPERIVSLSPTATEMLFAIGAGGQVVAVDLYSNYPADAPAGTLDAFVPDLEAIVATDPDLVVSMGLPPDIENAFGELDIDHLTQPAAVDLEQVFAQIEELGQATGQVDGAAKVNEVLQAQVDEVLAGIPERETALTVYHEIDDSFYTASSATFIGQVYAAMGLDNIADDHDDGSGYPLIDGETIIAANPDVIVYTTQAPYDAAEISARPGWDSISAVADGRIIEVDADTASRWGPRIVEFMEAIAEAMA